MIKSYILKFILNCLNFFSGPIGKVVQGLANLRRPKILVQFFIRLIFIKKFKVKVSEIEKPLDSYVSFLDFFTRRLKPEARPINKAKEVIISPVDGEIVAHGLIHLGELTQIKNSTYQLFELLSISSNHFPNDKLEKLLNGTFINLYLSPKDYHCIHHPYDANLVKAIHVPGEHLPVNQFSLTNFKKVFARNERLILIYEARGFFFVAVWVGAFNVSKFRIDFDQKFYEAGSSKSSLTTKKILSKEYTNLIVKKGELAGAFELGSSVLLLFPKLKNHSFFFPNFSSFIKMGEKLANYKINEKNH